MERERNANIRQRENSKKGRIPAFYAEEQKDREYAIKTSLFRARDDGDGRDGLFGSGERRERPSHLRGKEGVTIVPCKTSSPSSRPSRLRGLTVVSGQTAVR